ncbi:unnamed protein product, partial [Rotaria sordida]
MAYETSIQNVNNKQHVSMNDGENKENVTLIWFNPNTRSEKTSHEDLLTKYSNIIGIYINFDNLCKSIKEEIDFINKQIQTCSFINEHQITCDAK